MKLTISPTSQIVDLNGTEARVWEGTSDDGASVTLFVVRVAVAGRDMEAFDRELKACAPPSEVWPARMVL